ESQPVPARRHDLLLSRPEPAPGRDAAGQPRGRPGRPGRGGHAPFLPGRAGDDHAGGAPGTWLPFEPERRAPAGGSRVPLPGRRGHLQRRRAVLRSGSGLIFRARETGRGQPQSPSCSVAMTCSMAFSVYSMSSSVWAAVTNHASYTDGARLMPAASMRRKKRANMAVSLRSTAATSRTGSSVNATDKAPARWFTCTGTPWRAADSRSPRARAPPWAVSRSYRPGSCSAFRHASPAATDTGLPAKVPDWYTGPTGAT